MEVRLAGIEDMEGIRALLRKYHRDTIAEEDRSDGFVTTAITDEQLAERSFPSLLRTDMTRCLGSALRHHGNSGLHGRFSGT